MYELPLGEHRQRQLSRYLLRVKSLRRLLSRRARMSVITDLTNASLSLNRR